MENSIFQRHELKYLVTETQRARLEEAFESCMVPDPHGESTICNVYYDTPDFRLIRASLEKPIYKEKLRLRSYGCAAPEDTVFLELKKKYKGIVYKRRVSVPCRAAEDYFAGRAPLPDCGQIGREIDYFKRFYGSLYPAVYLCYDRTAYYARESTDLRVTFDRNIAWRQQAVRLTAPTGGRQILAPGWSLMEVKAADAIPLWLAEWISAQGIRQSSFSKYGEAYKTILAETRREMLGGIVNV
ncbi:MAG: polyphosphate polymerase domain-containing protein [Oscillospiraceae bacterium]|nr:polyphosphate polymerase domain-containing protein [Oscillospiraceae bacterium]